MKIQDVKCTPVMLQPGTRLLVQVQRTLNKEEYEQLRKTIQKWAGPMVPVLIIDTSIKIGIEHAGERKIELAGGSR